MNCWHCDRPAHGSCAFCGRGVCREHTKTRANFVALYRAAPKKENTHGTMRAVAVENALWCEVCTPRENPVDMPELDS